jgi:hypothetical protein
MTMKRWTDMHEYFSDLGLRLNRLSQASGLETEFQAIQQRVAAGVLALAGTVAHTSERKFAPIASFAAGIAVERLRNAGVLSTEQDVVDFIRQLCVELEGSEPDHDPKMIREVL